MNRALAALGVATVLTVAACTSSTAGSAPTDAPVSSSRARPHHVADRSRPTWVVTVGDSYISGEGARWAGNTSGRPQAVDALGADAYFDADDREAEPGCHRASQAVVSLGQGLRSANLACSGASTRSKHDRRKFTPGLDFSRDAAGDVGQALALQGFATHHHVSAVVVSIGGNDFGFASLVGRCISDYIGSIASRPVYCRDDPVLASTVSAANRNRVARRVSEGLLRVAAAMRRAGYHVNDYRLIVQNYPSPLPPGPRIRYDEDQLARTFTGGCPVYDVDATWANRTVVPTINRAVSSAIALSALPRVTRLDMSTVLRGHRLCEQGVDVLTGTDVRSWRSPGAVNELEWVNAVYTKGAPWQVEESLHPNYWGIRAERDCLRQLLRRPDSPRWLC